MPATERPFTVVATFADMQAARAAVDALEGGGVEANRVSMTGRQVEDAATSDDTSARDRRLTGDITRKVVNGALAGAVAGAVVGAIAGVLVFGIGAAGMWALVLGAALAGSAVGGVARGVAKIDMQPDWELTYDDTPGSAVGVAVRAEDENEADAAVELLMARGPTKVNRYDSQGRPVPSG